MPLQQFGVVARRQILRGRLTRRPPTIVAGSPRSGTTWLANVVAAASRSAVLFEPLHLDHVPAARDAGFDWRTFVSPDRRWPDGERFIGDVFEGRVLNKWTMKEISFQRAIRCDSLVTKFVRASGLVNWMTRYFSARALFLVRHPCAVVASQLRMSAWASSREVRVPRCLMQAPQLAAVIERAKQPFERLAVQWGIDNLMALIDRDPHGGVHVVSYEALLREGTAGLDRIVEEYGAACSDAARELAAKPSSTTHNAGRSGVSGWRSQLSAGQCQEVIDTAAAFGLDFYSADVPEPDVERLESDELTTDLRRKFLNCVGTNAARETLTHAC